LERSSSYRQTYPKEKISVLNLPLLICCQFYNHESRKGLCHQHLEQMSRQRNVIICHISYLLHPDII